MAVWIGLPIVAICSFFAFRKYAWIAGGIILVTRVLVGAICAGYEGAEMGRDYSRRKGTGA
jgi:hypothetical protein